MELISSKIAGFQPQMAMGLPEPIRPKLIGTSVRVGRPAFPGGVMVEHEAEGTLLVRSRLQDVLIGASLSGSLALTGHREPRPSTLRLPCSRYREWHLCDARGRFLGLESLDPRATGASTGGLAPL